jgi:hypothetical protein
MPSYAILSRSETRPGNAQILFLENSLGAPLFDRGVLAVGYACQAAVVL